MRSLNNNNFKIMHIITSLEANGAQLMMLRLAEKMKENGYIIKVISLTSKNKISENLKINGIELSVINFESLNLIYNLYILGKEIKKFNPNVVQTWMYHGDLIGGCIAKLVGVKLIFWNIRHSDVDKKGMKITTRIIARICAFLSKIIPTKIICNSQKAINIHKKIGYKKSKFIYIPNGFNLAKIYQSTEKKLNIRKKLKLKKDTLLIGTIGRFHKQKDYPTIIKAAKYIFDKKKKNIFFLFCGDNIDYQNKELCFLLKKYKLQNKVKLLGYRKDIHNIIFELDLLVSSSSYGEGFPNVIGEAMSLSIPCIATDVGDSKMIIRDSKYIVQPENSKKLAELILDFCKLSKNERKIIGIKNKKIIEKNYSIEKVFKTYINTYKNNK